MLTTIPTTTQTTQTTLSKGGRRRRRLRRSVARRRAMMRSSVDDSRFDEASSSSSFTSSEASKGVHVVSPGDSLYGVAVHYGVDPRDLIVRRLVVIFFLPFVVVVGLFFPPRTQSSLLSATTSRESGSSLCILNSKRWNAMTLTKRYAGETEPLILFDCEYYSQRQQQAANAKTLGGFEYVLPGQRLVIPGRMNASGGGHHHQSSVETNSNSAFLDGGERRRRQQQRQQVYKSGNISSNFLAEKGGPTTTMTMRMPTIVTAVSFVFGLAFGLFLFSRERE